MIIIGLTGRAGCGKDTVADFLCEAHGFVKIALADPIREGAKAMFGLTDEQLHRRDLKEQPIDWIGHSPRHILQTLGTEYGRQYVSDDIWLRVAGQRIERIRRSAPCMHVSGIVISDIRFENEADWLRNLGGHLWFVRRPGHNPLMGKEACHASERAIQRKTDEAIISNYTTIDDLHFQVTEALLEIEQ